MRTLMITLLLGAASVQAETVNTTTASPASVSQTVNANSEQGNIMHPLANLDAQQVIDQAIAAYGGELFLAQESSKQKTSVSYFDLKGTVLAEIQAQTVADYVGQNVKMEILGPDNQVLATMIYTLEGGATYSGQGGFVPMPDTELANGIGALYVASNGIISTQHQNYQAENLGVQTWTLTDGLQVSGVVLKMSFAWSEDQTYSSLNMFDEQARVVATRYSIAALGEVTEYIKPESYQQQDGMLLSLGSDAYLSNGMLFAQSKLLTNEVNPELPDDFFAIE